MKWILSAIAALFLASAPAHADNSNAKDKIRASAAAWSQLYAARDLDSLMLLYHPEARLFTNGQPALIGPAAIRAYFKQNYAQSQSATIDFKIEDITVFEDTAMLVSLYKMDIDIGKAEPITAVGRSMLVYKRDAFGHWLLFSDMDNIAPDATVEAFSKKE